MLRVLQEAVEGINISKDIELGCLSKGIRNLFERSRTSGSPSVPRTRPPLSFPKTKNQSVYLPLGCVHRLFHPGKIALELIEVQVGSYLGEDDIIRLHDKSNRASDTDAARR
jgi:hypothetical protein